MKPHERWWEDHPTRHAEFAGWLRQSDASSREAVCAIADGLRELPWDRVRVLEVGPGIYLDWDTIWQRRQPVQYRAVDVTPRIVAEGRARGLDVIEGSIEALPLPDGCVDLAYCRHVLEHLPTYRDALLELCRVASHLAVAVLWRLDPDAADDVTHFGTVADVPATYHNMYSRAAVTAFLDAHTIAHTWQRADADWLLIMDASST